MGRVSITERGAHGFAMAFGWGGSFLTTTTPTIPRGTRDTACSDNTLAHARATLFTCSLGSARRCRQMVLWGEKHGRKVRGWEYGLIGLGNDWGHGVYFFFFLYCV
jgi:hypothetical protein